MSEKKCYALTILIAWATLAIQVAGTAINLIKALSEFAITVSDAHIGNSPDSRTERLAGLMSILCRGVRLLQAEEQDLAARITKFNRQLRLQLREES